MSTPYRTYWIGSVFVAEWEIVDDAGAPVDDATVTGTVTTPTGTAPMTVTHDGGTAVYRGAYQAVAAGRHGWKMTSSGTATGAVAGEFVVTRDVTGAAPITVDPTTTLGQIRLLTTDVDEAYPLHTDADLTAFLAMEGGSVKRAAAASLEAISTSETLVSRKITTQDLSTDGPAVAKDLRERAKLLRQQAADADAVVVDTDYGYGFDAVAMPERSTWAGW